MASLCVDLFHLQVWMAYYMRHSMSPLLFRCLFSTSDQPSTVVLLSHRVLTDAITSSTRNFSNSCLAEFYNSLKKSLDPLKGYLIRCTL